MLNKQTVGNIGLYYVCYRLSRLAWNVMPTSRNAKGVDILAYGEDGSRKLTFQVKALSKRTAVGLGKNPDHLIADYLVVCRYVQREPPQCFILAPEEVKRLCHPSGRGKEARYWLEPLQYEAPEFLDNWKRIGPPTPPAAIV
jgi:hypothetical protein